ncbi:Ig-like domain-containing protein, partial [Pirellulales bacterium]|nr:Ig-like domain-containing protein [Pirellulales bacterium]
VINSVTASNDGDYEVGDTIRLTAVFSQPVTVVDAGGTPSISLTIGSNTRAADCVSGSGTTILVFEYVVATGDLDADGIDVSSLVDLNLGTIRDADGNDAVLTFTPPTTTGIVVQTAELQNVTVSDGTYADGDTISLTATFDSIVNVTGTPQIALTLDGATVFADFASGSGTTALVFNYTVDTNDLDADGIVVNSPILLSGGTIQDAGNNDAILTFTPPTTTGVLVDAVAPVATLVTPPADGLYVTGQTLSLQVTFDDNVDVTGTPVLPLTIGSTTRNASYISGTGTNTLTFEYTVQSTDQDGNGIAVDPTSISGIITDAAGNDADFSTATVTSPAGVFVNAAVINSVTVGDGTYGDSDVISLTALFSQPVDVGGTPRIALTVGGNSVFADYVSGSGTTALVFNYIVQTDDLDTDGIIVGTPVDLNGGTIRDTDSNNAVLTFTAPTTTAVLVDAVAPVAIAMAPPPGGSYVTNDVLSFDVVFDGNVEVAGTPMLPLTIGTTSRNAEYVSGTGTNTLTFEYTILSTDQDGDGITVDPTSITTGITDAAGNSADLTTVSSPSTAAVIVNSAIINTVSASAPGDYVAGDMITLTVVFSQPVDVNTNGGTPGIALTVGSNASIFAGYTSGTGTTTLVFEYEVQPGDVDTDGILVADRVSLNGGTINDIGGAPAVLGLTPPTDTGILVDAQGPSLPTLVTPAAGTYVTGDVLTFNLVFDEVVQVTGNPRIPLEIGTNSPAGTPIERLAVLSAGAGTTTLTFEYTVQSTDHDIDGLQINSPIDGLITDAFGNGANLNIPSLTEPGIRINPIKITSLTASANGDYITGQHVDFTATFTEAVNVLGAPTIELAVGLDTISAEYLNGIGTDSLTFRYSVGLNDLDEDGISITSTDIILPVGSLIEAASDGTLSLLSFIPPETSGITVNAVPRITAVSTTTPDGAYDIDDVIDIQVTTSRPVKVTDAGNATLELNTGVAGTDFATFIGSVNVFSNTLAFQYIVQDGDYSADLDYLATDSLTLAAVSEAGISLLETLEAPGSTNSIAFNHDVAISTIQPVVETITTMTPDGAYSVSDEIIIQATLSVAGPAGQQFVLQLNAGNIAILTTDGLGGAEGIYEVDQGDSTDRLKVLAIDPNNTTDAANNPLSSALPSSVTVGNISIDTEAPVITKFGVSEIDNGNGTSLPIDQNGTAGTFGVDSIFAIFAIASEDLREGSSINATLNNGETVLLSAPTNTSSDTLSGDYRVKPGDLSINDLTIESFVPVVIKDIAGTDLASTVVPEHPDNIGDVHDLHIDTMPPNVTAFSATSGFFNENKIITINANLSEPISDNSNFTVTLSNNEDVVMSVLAGQDTATGNYTVQAGDNEDPLTIVTIHSVTDVEDALENPLQTDLPTGFNLGDTSAVVLDTTDPTVVSITSDQLTLNGTQTATLTITLSEQSDDFDETDLTFNNATISNFTDLGGGDVYTVELIPEAEFEGPITASVSNSSFTDLADNSFDTTTENATIDVDTKAPSILITSDDNALSIGETANLTFTLSETSSDFDVSDISAANGTISNFTQNASDLTGLTYLAEFTPANTFEGDDVVSVAADSIQDAFLNPNEESTLTLAVDTVAPTVTSFSATSGSYKATELVTINANLSEAMSGPSGFDITLSNSQIVTMNILDGETTAVGTYIVQAGDNENPLTVLAIGAGTATDEATNPLVTTIPGGSNLGDTSTVILDTIAPSAVITASPVAVKIGESSTVTITLSEDSNDFDLSKINVVNGFPSDFQPTIPDSVYQFTFTPTADFEGVATISINAGAFTDVAGNPSAALATETITVDTTAPPALTLALGSSITLPISRSEAIGGFLVIGNDESGATLTATIGLADGSFVLPLRTLSSTIIDLPAGDHALLGGQADIKITVRQTDAAGNVGPDSAPFIFHLDTVIAAPTLAVRNNVTDPLTLAEITDASGILNVQGELDAVITVTFAGYSGGFPLSYTGTGFNQPIILTQADVDQLGEGPITVTATQTDDAGNPSTVASLTLIFDQTAPEVDLLYLDVSSGSYGPGVPIPVVGTLSEPAVEDQILNVILNVLEFNGNRVVVPVTVQANGTAIEGTYVVQIGHNTDDLTIDGHTNDHPSGPVTDLAGNELLDSSSNSSSNLKTLGGGSAGVLSTGIIIDTIPPEITEWLPTADTYYDGDDVLIQVRISEAAMPGTTISVRPNTLGASRDSIELTLDSSDPAKTLFTGAYTVALGESTQGADLIVTVDPSTTLTDLAGNALVIPIPATQTGVIIDGSVTLAAEMEWGPNPGNGYSTVSIELSTGVTGMNLGAFELTHNGRTISLRGASLVETDTSNYVLVLPPRIASMTGDGSYIIAIFSSDILSIKNPKIGLENPLEGELDLPDPGMNTNNQGWSR